MMIGALLTTASSWLLATALATLALTTLAITRQLRSGTLLSLNGGLHVNTLVTMGLGPVSYVLFPDFFSTERIDQQVIVEHALVPFVMFLVGYAVTVVLELQTQRRVDSRPVLATVSQLSTAQVFVLLGLAGAGLVATELGLNVRGAGNVFNILFLFLFPIVTLTFVRLKRDRIDTWITLIIINALVCGYCVTSTWRSYTVLYAVSAMLGVAMRVRLRPRFLFALTAVCIAWYIWLFPFLQLKKFNPADNLAGMWSLFRESQSVPLSDRVQEGFAFFGGRMNGVREIGYVANGVASGTTNRRNGMSYLETVLQLVPRVVWPDKPSFNATMNYVLPREIGILSWDDPDTSGGVGLWAEEVWNLTGYFLPIFVPVVFLFVRGVDRFVLRMRIGTFFKWWMFSCLFYLSLQVLSFVIFVTMVLWTLIVLYAYARVFGAIFGDPGASRPAPPPPVDAGRHLRRV